MTIIIMIKIGNLMIDHVMVKMGIAKAENHVYNLKSLDIFLAWMYHIHSVLFYMLCSIVNFMNDLMECNVIHDFIQIKVMG